eukprot:13188192-Alexandrium_andersonii.AAC.2
MPLAAPLPAFVGKGARAAEPQHACVAVCAHCARHGADSYGHADGGDDGGADDAVGWCWGGDGGGDGGGGGRGAVSGNRGQRDGWWAHEAPARRRHANTHPPLLLPPSASSSPSSPPLPPPPTSLPASTLVLLRANVTAPHARASAPACAYASREGRAAAPWLSQVVCCPPGGALLLRLPRSELLSLTRAPAFAGAVQPEARHGKFRAAWGAEQEQRQGGDLPCP